MTTYTIKAEWDTGKPSGQGSYTRYNQTEEDVMEARAELRDLAPAGSTHTIRVIAE